MIEVAAIFQKDPQVLIAHPDAGVETFADLAKLPTIFMGKDGFATGFQWMKAAYPGFKDEQYKPYTFNPAPFLADKMSAQQGYLTSEPYEIEKQGGFKPKLFLLADAGYDPTRPRSRPSRTTSPRTPTSCSASSMPRSSAGTTTSTATTKRPTT